MFKTSGSAGVLSAPLGLLRRQAVLHRAEATGEQRHDRPLGGGILRGIKSAILLE